MAPAVEHHHVVIIGGGTAGIAVAARLRRKGNSDVAVIEPSETHWYQPLWTLVGGGCATIDETHRPESRVMPAVSPGSAELREASTPRNGP